MSEQQIESSDPPVMNPSPGRGGPPASSVGGLVLGSAKQAWRTLRTMRTALWLLAVLAVESVVATVVPQWPNVPGTVREWRAGTAGPGATVSSLLDTVGAFDVYASPLFLATLLLLFTSLTACLIPRIRAWWRMARHAVPPLTRHLGDQEHVQRMTVDRSPAEARWVVLDLLAEDGWRTRTGEAGRDGRTPSQVAGEKGLVVREGSSLLFHLSFYVLLVSIVVGQLTTFEGFVSIVEGEAFTDTPIDYGVNVPGRWFGPEDHAGFTLGLDDFRVDWIRDPLAPGAGTPTLFEADVTVSPRDGGARTETIASNQPIVVDGFKIHLLGWGYAPRIVVRGPDGEPVFDGFSTTVFSEEEGAFTGVVKVPAAEPADLGLELLLVPFAPDDDDGVPQLTGAPWADAPLLVYTPWAGDLALDDPQRTDQLDTTAMTRGLQDLMRVGDVRPLGGGFEVELVELRQWSNLQVSRRPQVPWLLLGAAMMLGGLVPSLYSYRRRLWVATEATGDGRTLLTVAGRAFQRPEAFDEEFAELVATFRSALEARDHGDDDTGDVADQVAVRPHDPAVAAMPGPTDGEHP